MAEAAEAADDFEIDFYGDADIEQPENAEQSEDADQLLTEGPLEAKAPQEPEEEIAVEEDAENVEASNDRIEDDPASPHTKEEVSNEEIGIEIPHDQADPIPQEDHRPVDPVATFAIMISEVPWWQTDDDIRGWIRQAKVEHEMKDLTFSEHKVNGKSKGQVYVEFATRQGATAAKHYIHEMMGDKNLPAQKKMTAFYWNPGVNPFKTLPKDAPTRVKGTPRPAPSGPHNDRGNFAGNYRGRGAFVLPRGNMNPGDFPMARNFTNTMGFNNFGPGFVNPAAGENFGFCGARGAMMGGMRGNPGGMRGGRGRNMMGMGPMGGMPMGMPGTMGMMGMGGPMPGFQNMTPNFGGPGGGLGFGFGPTPGGGNDWGNPHGAKRPRPE